MIIYYYYYYITKYMGWAELNSKTKLGRSRPKNGWPNLEPM